MVDLIGNIEATVNSLPLRHIESRILRSLRIDIDYERDRLDDDNRQQSRAMGEHLNRSGGIERPTHEQHIMRRVASMERRLFDSQTVSSVEDLVLLSLALVLERWLSSSFSG